MITIRTEKVIIGETKKRKILDFSLQCEAIISEEEFQELVHTYRRLAGSLKKINGEARRHGGESAWNGIETITIE